MINCKLIKKDQHNINLLYYKFEKQREDKNIMLEIAIYSSILIILLSIIGLIFFNQSNQLQRVKAEKSKLEDKLSNFTDIQAFKQSIEQSRKQLEDARKQVKNLEELQYNVVGVMDELYKICGQDIVLAQTHIKENSMVVNGYTNNMTMFLTFLERLKESPYFDEPELFSSQVNQENGEVSFNIEISWEEVIKLNEHI